MTGIEINEKIKLNNKVISDALNPSTFVLNNTVAELLAENKKLQQQCPHQFDEGGFCMFCYLMEE